MPDPEAAREGGGQERDSAAGAALPKYHSGRRRPITALASTLSQSLDSRHDRRKLVFH